MPAKILSEPIPIERTMHADDGKYVYGYAIIFDSADGHGTLMTKQFFESNLERLKKFPAVRFQHDKPLGQIIWDREVEGKSTFIDSHGLHVLVRIYDEQEKIWRMINEGAWGFSWAATPTKTGQACSPSGICYTTLEEGKMWEVSIVDAPSHLSCAAYVLKRSMDFVGRPAQPPEIGDIIPLASDGVSLSRSFERAKRGVSTK